MRKGGYYVNNTLLGQVDKGTSGRVNKLIVNELIVKEDKVTREQVDCEGRQSNRGTGGKGLLYMG
nr:hypothetical protein [uncultured Prevotella sp.]